MSVQGPHGETWEHRAGIDSRSESLWTADGKTIVFTYKNVQRRSLLRVMASGSPTLWQLIAVSQAEARRLDDARPQEWP